MEDSRVVIQPSDLIILPVIEKATILSGQKSKAEKTRKDKGEKKKKQREGEMMWESKKEEKHEVQAAQTIDCWTCSLLARYLIITGPNLQGSTLLLP